MNPLWNKWIFSSVAKHFKAKCEELHIPLYIESFPRDTSSLKDWIELRIDGPHYTPQTKNQWEITLEVNVVVSSAKDNINSYRYLEAQGNVVKMFSNIPVYKLGLDESLVVCLQTTQGKIVTRNFGQVGPTVALNQSSVEAHYRAFLQG